jgi:plasmid maintenance system antidote protein VapI
MNKLQILQDESALLSPPGGTLLKIINGLKMSQNELGGKLWITTEKLKYIIDGKARITTALALKPEKMLVLPAHFWINRERLYRETLASIVLKKSIYLKNSTKK